MCQLPAVSNQLYLCKTDFFDIIDNLKKLKQLGARVVDRCRVRIFQCNRKYPPKESGGWQTGYNERGYNESGYNEGGYSEHETVCAAEMSIVFML